MTASAVLGPVLVTGATGTIGWHIARQLHAAGLDVRALVRDPARAQGLVPAGVGVVQGDLGDASTLRSALDGVATVFHAAGLPEQWLADPTLFDRVNAEGTRALAVAALEVGVTAFVHTSTIDVLAKTPGVRFDESTLDARPLGTPYQRSKQRADQIVAELLDAGLPARFTHPSALFGPSPSRTPGTNDLLADLAANKVPLLPPGGLPLAFAPDVARGHVAAATAPIGSRYVLSDDYLPLTEIARLVRQVVPNARIPRVMPYPVARLLAATGQALSRVLKKPPMLPTGQLHFLVSHVLPDSTRARAELEWAPTPIAAAIAATLHPPVAPAAA